VGVYDGVMKLMVDSIETSKTHPDTPNRLGTVAARAPLLHGNSGQKAHPA